MIANLTDAVVDVLRDYGKLPTDAAGLDRDDDLYQSGLTSHATVNVMLALEDAFDVEFPERMLQRKTFESIAAIEQALSELLADRS